MGRQLMGGHCDKYGCGYPLLLKSDDGETQEWSCTVCEIKDLEARIAELEKDERKRSNLLQKKIASMVEENYWSNEDHKKKNETIATLREALESISKNACCEPCQEAKLVARSALKECFGDN